MMRLGAFRLSRKDLQVLAEDYCVSMPRDRTAPTLEQVAVDTLYLQNDVLTPDEVARKRGPREQCNTRDRRRWLHEFRAAARVANDLLEGGERGRAIGVLVQNTHMALEDAIYLTGERPTKLEDWGGDTDTALRLRECSRLLEEDISRSVFQALARMSKAPYLSGINALWSQIEATYNSMMPDTATGAELDALADLTIGPNGDVATRAGETDDELRERVLAYLRTRSSQQGEWFLDMDVGVPLFDVGIPKVTVSGTIDIT